MIFYVTLTVSRLMFGAVSYITNKSFVLLPCPISSFLHSFCGFGRSCVLITSFFLLHLVIFNLLPPLFVHVLLSVITKSLIRLFFLPTFFKMSCECYILQAFVPLFLLDKFTLSWPNFEFQLLDSSTFLKIFFPDKYALTAEFWTSCMHIQVLC